MSRKIEKREIPHGVFYTSELAFSVHWGKPNIVNYSIRAANRRTPSPLAPSWPKGDTAARTMPWIEFYPSPGQARGVQVAIKADRIGLRYPVEDGLVSAVKATLQALAPVLRRKADRSFLEEGRSGGCGSGTA